MTAMVQMFKVRYSMSRGSASWGENVYFEDVSALSESLLPAYLETLVEYPSSVQGTRYRLARDWLTFLRKKQETPEDAPVVKKIQGVYQFVDNDWVEIRAEFVEPEVHLIGARQ